MLTERKKEAKISVRTSPEITCTVGMARVESELIALFFPCNFPNVKYVKYMVIAKKKTFTSRTNGAPKSVRGLNR